MEVPAFFTGLILGIVFICFIGAGELTRDAKIKNSQPIEISGSVYVCQKAEVKVGK